MSENTPPAGDASSTGAASAAGSASPPEVGIPRDLAFSERGFLFDPTTGLTYTLNRTGAFLFQRLRHGTAAAEATAALAAEFDVELPRAADDVRDFVQQLRDFGLA
ncbi:MAG: HPr-rel-A system PqqD family peptide chaperone [Planctomycetes bacterium]|nr:HPr-rel-A system PqqD family peptide chaperone [Planctomycetota bacterium]